AAPGPRGRNATVSSTLTPGRSLVVVTSVVVARRGAGHVAVFDGGLQTAAVGETAHQIARDLLPRRLAGGDFGQGACAASRDLFIRDQGVTATRAQIDADAVAGAQPRQAAADGAFGRGVQDGRAVGSAGLATVADDRQVVDAAFDQGVGRLHV